jgi:hypothetical protein
VLEAREEMRIDEGDGAEQRGIGGVVRWEHAQPSKRVMRGTAPQRLPDNVFDEVPRVGDESTTTEPPGSTPLRD